MYEYAIFSSYNSPPMLPNDGIAVTYDSVELLLPEGITVFDIDYIGLWCKLAAANFGYVQIPPREQLNVLPYYYVPGPEVSFHDNNFTGL